MSCTHRGEVTAPGWITDSLAWIKKLCFIKKHEDATTLMWHFFFPSQNQSSAPEGNLSSFSFSLLGSFWFSNLYMCFIKLVLLSKLKTHLFHPWLGGILCNPTADLALLPIPPPKPHNKQNRGVWWLLLGPKPPSCVCFIVTAHDRFREGHAMAG